MTDSLGHAIAKARAGEDLTTAETVDAIEYVMAGEASDEQIGDLLLALREKGEAVAEVAGAASVLRRHMTTIPTTRTGLVDTCGTGGDGSRTFNISTAAAIVTAAAGVPVAKHGNRGITSKSGSADVLTALGVNVEADVARVGVCLDELGICFCYAPLLHASMKRVAHVRRDLGVPTIFNLLGPLSNPAHAEYQLLGVGRPELRNLLAASLAELGAKAAVVVCGEDGLDEVTLAGATLVTEVRNGELREHRWTPDDFGLERSDRLSLLVNGPHESAAMIRRVLAGAQGPPRDIVVANAGVALWLAGRAESLNEGARLAEETLDSGAAARLLKSLGNRTHGRAG